MRANSTNGKCYQLTIDQYQIHTGTRHPVLEDTRHFSWIPHRWISLTRQFLHSINAQIWIQAPYVPKPCHNKDRWIMEDVLTYLPPKHHEMINSVHMYLCVNLLSEITHSNGQSILTSIIDRSAQPFCSHLQWPYQSEPTAKAWCIWNEAILTIYCDSNTAGHLKHPLGAWHHDTMHAYCMWNWVVNPNNQMLYQCTTRYWNQYHPIHQGHRYTTYEIAHST